MPYFSDLAMLAVFLGISIAMFLFERVLLGITYAGVSVWKQVVHKLMYTGFGLAILLLAQSS